MSVLLVIPARYASTRYPGKPLVPLRGASGTAKSLIQRSWETAREIAGVSRVVIATDDDRIASAGTAFGAEIVMTSSECRNGTERCAEAHAVIGGGYEIVVNLQGDAPLTPPWFIENLLAGLGTAGNVGMATPVLRCDGKALAALKADRQAGRVGGTTAVFTEDHRGLYFSKEVIPFTDATYEPDESSPVFHHVGVYAYRPGALSDYAKWPIGPLERLEGLEQLRFLENGQQILCVEVDGHGRTFWELNNPTDVLKIETIMADAGID